MKANDTDDVMSMGLELEPAAARRPPDRPVPVFPPVTRVARRDEVVDPAVVVTDDIQEPEPSPTR